MKSLIRFGLLAGLFLCVAAWVILMGIGAGGSGLVGILGVTGVTTATDGSTLEISSIDKVKFSRITTYLSIKNKVGDVLSGLRKENFSVLEDGIPATILEFVGAGDQPLTAILVIDQSGSMQAENKMQGAINAASNFLDNVRPDRDTIGVIAFSTSQNELGAPKRVSAADIAELQRKVKALRVEGSTEFYKTVEIAANKLRGMPGRRAIIALTDGVDNSQMGWLSWLGMGFSTDDTKQYKTMLQTVKDADVTVYTIGLGSELDEKHLKAMAKESNGEYYAAPNANDLTGLYRKLAKGLQNEYSLTYASPTPRQDGTQRLIQITTRLPAGNVVTNGNYVVGGLLVSKNNFPLLLLLLPLLLIMLPLPILLKFIGRLLRGNTNQSDDVIAGPQWSLPPGQPVTPIACPKCYNQLRTGAKFCGKCGYRL